MLFVKIESSWDLGMVGGGKMKRETSLGREGGVVGNGGRGKDASLVGWRCGS